MVWLLAFALASGLGGPGDAPADVPTVAANRSALAASLLANESRRVRSTNGRISKLLAEGVRRSRTFADIVSQVHETNVIVYLEPVHDLPGGMSGRIVLQTVAGGQRYLRVQVRATLPTDQTISVIAHELRHALEVAADTSVVDDDGLVALYKRIGHVSYGERGYDTDAADATGRIVRGELIG